MPLGLVQADLKMGVGQGQRVTQNVPGDGAGQGKGAGHTPVPKARFLNLGTADVLYQMILCCGAVLCIAGRLAASLASTHHVPGTSFL